MSRETIKPPETPESSERVGNGRLYLTCVCTNCESPLINVPVDLGRIHFQGKTLSADNLVDGVDEEGIRETRMAVDTHRIVAKRDSHRVITEWRITIE